MAEQPRSLSARRDGWLPGGIDAWIASHELIFLALAAPFLLFPNRWTPLALALILLTWLCRRIAFGRFTIPTALDVPLALLLLMTLLAAFLSADPGLSQAKVWGIVLQLAVFYGVANSVRTPRHVLRMAGLLVALAVAVALLAVVGTDWQATRLLDLPHIYDRLPRLIEGLPGSGVAPGQTLFHPREVGGTLALLLPLPLALLFFGTVRWLRLLSAVALLLGGLVLLLSLSLQAFLGLGMALFLIAVWRTRWALLTLPAGLLALAVWLWSYGPLRAALALLSLDHVIGVGVVLRLEIWSRALAMIGDMPYTGIGLNSFPLILAHFYPGFVLGTEVHAHNFFLQTAVDLGLPGLLALLWLLVAFAYTVIQGYRATGRRDDRVILVGLAAGVLAFVGNGLVDAITLGAKPVAGLFAMLGLAVAIRAVAAQPVASTPAEQAQARTPVTDRPPSLWRWLVPATLFTALVILTVILAPATWWRNVGAIRAHSVLLDARRTGAPGGEAIQHALEPLSWAPDPGRTSDLVASLYAWQGDYGASVAALERHVASEGSQPMLRYAPAEAFRRPLAGDPDHDPWDDLLAVYRHWQNRYPGRAETYVKSAIIWRQHKGNADRAASILEAGLANNAQPAGLLTYSLSQVRGGP
jgi:O-antigen ligase